MRDDCVVQWPTSLCGGPPPARTGTSRRGDQRQRTCESRAQQRVQPRPTDKIGHRPRTMQLGSHNRIRHGESSRRETSAFASVPLRRRPALPSRARKTTYKRTPVPLPQPDPLEPTRPTRAERRPGSNKDSPLPGNRQDQQPRSQPSRTPVASSRLDHRGHIPGILSGMRPRRAQIPPGTAHLSR
jgi:hypothetical protein